MFWVGLSLGKAIGIAAVGLIILIAACLGCVTVEKPNVQVRASLFDLPEANGPIGNDLNENPAPAPQSSTPLREPDALEQDPRWEALAPRN